MKPVEILIKARDQASGVLGSIGGKLTAVAAAVAGLFGIATFASAVRGAADLEGKLSEVRAVSGATKDEMVLLRKAAEDAGASTKFTATEAADALGNLARAGLTAKQSVEALPATLALAQAGNIGLADSAEIVTRTLAGFNLAANQSGRIADVLAAGANASNTSVKGLAEALSYAAPTAVALGLSLETVVALVGKMADGGIDAGRAGTALNAVMAQFADPASKFRQELAAIGIVTNNFEDALRQLAKAGPEGQKAIRAVGLEAGPGLQTVLNQGIGALDDLKKKLDDAKGSAAATAATMEDNLQGAARGLGSAWDTVKNALATPVLPVLKEGVTQLADALRSAVADGTVGRFGESIATAFQSGLRWAREFAGQVDFAALGARMQVFAAQAGDVFVQIGDYARNTGNIVQTAYGVMSAGTNAVMTAVYVLAEAWARVAEGVMTGLATVREGLAKVTFGELSREFKAAADDARVSAGAFGAAADAMRQKAVASFTAMGDGAQLARDGWAGLTEEQGKATRQMTAGERAIRSVSETLKEMGGDATAAGQKAQAAALQQKQAAESARAAVADLKREYEAALAAGNVQLALEKLSAMRQALQQTGAQAQVTAQDVANAFTRLGVTSSAELAKLRDAALRDYEIIKAAGTSTARDKAEAFRAYAEKAIAANSGVVAETLKTEAAIRGVVIAVDEAGKATVRIAEGTGAATSRMADDWRKVGAAAKQAGVDGTVSVQQLEQAAKKVAEINERYSRPTGNDGKTADGYEANKDGSGAGTFNNTLPVDKAFAVKQRVERGERFTGADLDDAKAAFAQAKNAYDDMQAFLKLNPGAASAEYQQSTTELFNATRNALQQAQASAVGGVPPAPAPGGPLPAIGATSRTVNVRISTNNGTTQTVPTTEEGAAALVKALQGARLSAG